MCAFKAANPRAVFADFLRWLLPPPFHFRHLFNLSHQFSFRYSPRDFICDQLEDYEPDRIERDDGGTVVITLGDMPSLGLDVPAGAGVDPSSSLDNPFLFSEYSAAYPRANQATQLH
jgi:hypothetical protein